MTWLIAALIYLAIPGMQIAFEYSSIWFLSSIEILDSVVAVMAFFWIVNGVLISLKVPVMQRLIPYDRAVRLHIYGSTGITLMILIHALDRIFAGKLIDVLSWSLLVGFFVIATMAIGWVRTRLFGWFQRWASRRFAGTRLASYDWMREVHSILFALLAIGMYVHISISELAMLVPPFSYAVYQVYFFTVIGLWTITKIRQLVLPKLVVSGVDHIGDLHVIRFAGPGLPIYRPGQFGFVSFLRHSVRGERHPFSFLSEGRDELSVAVKELGDHTSRYGEIQEGDRARINGPFGNFHPPKGAPLCLVGSGIGIVPVLSILKFLARNGDDRRVELFLAVNERRELLEPEVIEDAQATMPNLKVRVLVYNEDHTLFSEEYFRGEIDGPEELTAMVCSSQRVRRIVVGALHSIGVHRRRIKFENFAFGGGA